MKPLCCVFLFAKALRYSLRLLWLRATLARLVSNINVALPVSQNRAQQRRHALQSAIKSGSLQEVGHVQMFVSFVEKQLNTEVAR